MSQKVNLEEKKLKSQTLQKKSKKCCVFLFIYFLEKLIVLIRSDSNNIYNDINNLFYN